MFKARLLLELTHVFPKEMAVYRATRGDERGTQFKARLLQSDGCPNIFFIV